MHLSHSSQLQVCSELQAGQKCKYSNNTSHVLTKFRVNMWCAVYVDICRFYISCIPPTVEYLNVAAAQRIQSDPYFLYYAVFTQYFLQIL